VKKEFGKTSIEQLTWKEARKDIARVKPAFSAKVDEISPDDSLKLYRVSYPFGSDILKNGKLFLPDGKGGTLPIDSPDLDKSIKDDLQYSPNMPIGMVINNSIELYSNVMERTIPWVPMFPGRIFSLWGMLQASETISMKGNIWNIVAGSRSLLMLPKISQTGGYNRIKKLFSLQSAMPTGLTDQWPLFKELANTPAFEEPWHAELIFFSKEWSTKLHEPDWMPLKYYLLHTGWLDTSFLRDQAVFNFAFSMALLEKNLKPNPYLTDTVKHIYSVGRSTSPGFCVAKDNLAGPVSRYQEVFADDYGLKFTPTMMHSSYLNQTNPVYYSLEIPTTLAFSPKSRKASNKLSDIREIKHIERITSNYLVSDRLGISDSPLYDIVNRVDYSYYHSDFDAFGEAQNTLELATLDKSITEEAKRFPSSDFCHTSPFLRGCIRIEQK
jgi:hypothetical protein